jgi:phosphogluconate dehydratase
MPELHKLITPLAVVMGHGHRVAMVTDGRLSGASGKVPAAIHVTPEALCGGALAKVREGDMIRIDVPAGRLDVLLDEAAMAAREYADPGVREVRYGTGRQIFAPLRGNMQRAEEGASSIFTYVHEKCEVHLPFEEA